MTLRLNGSTSGYVELDAPAVAGTSALTLPSGVGTLLTAEGGKVLQVVRATDTTARSTTSASYVDASISVTITPVKSTSAILILWKARFQPASNQNSRLQITDSSNNPISGAEELLFQFGNSTVPILEQTLIGYATPATTSAVTYKGRFNITGGGTLTINNNSMTGQMFAIEVSA